MIITMNPNTSNLQRDKSIGNNSHQAARNVTPSYLRFVGTTTTTVNNTKRKTSVGSQTKRREISQERDYITATSSNNGDRSNSKASKCSLQVYQKRVLNMSKLRNTINTKKRQQQGKHQITKKNSIDKHSTNYYLQRENIMFVPQKMSNNFVGPNSRKSPGIGNRQPLSKDRLSNPKRNQDSLQKQEQRAKLQNKDLLFNLMKHQHVPNYMNKLKIKKQENNNNTNKKIVGTSSNILSSKQYKKRFFQDPSIQLKSAEALQRYQLHGQLGKGAYGVVRMAIDKINKQKYAVKIYEKSRLDEPNKIKNIQRQISILKRISHPVVSKLVQAVETSTQIYLVMQYGGANSLYKFLLSKQQHRLSQKQAKTFFKSIIEAVYYLHQKNIVHRDIKAENILLNRFKQLKLIDFGFSLISRPPQTIDTFCGTPTYMAPEIVSKKDHVALYTDLWSLGILYYVLVQGNYPFRAKTQNQLFQKIKKGSYEYIHDDISQRSKYLIKSLLNINPLQRISVQKLLQKQWIDWYDE